MRIGKNPAKLDRNNKVENKAFHQVIIPVYLPELKGYYKEGLDILKLCIESICLTVHDKTFISIINNGSCLEVRAYLDNCLENNKIHEVIHTSAIGKINAIAKGLNGHDFDLVTITDADVLFTNGWQKAVYDIYENFPKAGMVCTTPQSKRIKQYTDTIFFDNFLNKNFKFRALKSKDGFEKFVKSIGNENRFKNVHHEKILSIKKGNVVSVIGAGHFCSTYRMQLLRNIKYSKDKLSSESDRMYIDNPTVNFGHWRLSTYTNFTFHLGNKTENWMLKKLEKIKKNDLLLERPQIHEFRKYKFIQIKKIFIKRVLFKKFIWTRYLLILGLNKNEAMDY